MCFFLFKECPSFGDKPPPFIDTRRSIKLSFLDLSFNCFCITARTQAANLNPTPKIPSGITVTPSKKNLDASKVANVLASRGKIKPMGSMKWRNGR